MSGKIFVIIAAGLGIISQGCVSERMPAGAADKVTVLPSAAGERSLPSGGFSGLSGRWASEQTEFTTEKTADGFKIEILCHGSTANLSGTEKREDDDMELFSGEHVEVQISPRGAEDGIYFHFAVNPAGSLYHAKKRDVSWTPEGFRCSTETEKDFWKAVLEFKWETFGLKKPPEDGEAWSINVCRTIRKTDSPAEHTSWTGAANFHDILTMGRMEISGKQAEQALRIFHCGINGEGLLEVEAAKTGTGDGQIQVFDEGGLAAVKKLSGTDRFKFTCPLKDNYELPKGVRTVSIYLFGPRRIPMQGASGLIRTGSGDFMTPDGFEYSGAEKMTCAVASFPGKFTVRKESEIVLEQDASGKETEIPIGTLDPGRYVLEYSSGGKRSSRVFFIADKSKAEISAFPEKSRLRAKGETLFVDGKPVYLLGISGGSRTFFPSNPGFSLQYGDGVRKNPVRFHLFPGKKYVRKPFSGHAYGKNWKEAVGKYLRSTAKSELPVLRSICYEANLGVLLTKEDGSLEAVEDYGKFFEEVYRMAKKELPDDVISIHSDNLGSSGRLRDACDAFEYAGWRSSYHKENMILHFEEDFDRVRGVMKNKPLIPWLGGSIPDPVSRSAEELRAGVYLTILKGGAGNIIHMGHGGIPKHRTRFWSMLSMLPGEIDSFYSDLRTWSPLELELPGGFIGKAVKSPEGEILAVILNLTSREVTIDLELPGRGGKRKLTFTPLEPRVIRCKK